MFDVLKEAIEIIRQRRQLNRDTRRLQAATLDYEALQRICDNVATRNIAIEINQSSGNGMSTTIRILPKPLNQVAYKSFDERVQEARSAR